MLSQQRRATLSALAHSNKGYGTFVVCVTSCELGDARWVEPLTVRVALTARVSELKEAVRRASQLTATPLGDDAELRLEGGDRTVLEDNKRLRDYPTAVFTSGADVRKLPRGFAGALFITNGALGAALT
jgi:hypothetical protein